MLIVRKMRKWRKLRKSWFILCLLFLLPQGLLFSFTGKHKTAIFFYKLLASAFYKKEYSMALWYLIAFEYEKMNMLDEAEKAKTTSNRLEEIYRRKYTKKRDNKRSFSK